MKNYNKMYDEPHFETAEFVEESNAYFTDQNPIIDPVKDEIGIVNAREVFIRQGPGTNYDHIGTVKKGDEVIVLGREEDFLKIETEDGTQAYIMERFVDVA